MNNILINGESVNNFLRKIVLFSCVLGIHFYAQGQNFVCTSDSYFYVISSGNSKRDVPQYYLISLTEDKLIVTE